MICIHQQDSHSKGYIWDPEDAINFRRHHALLGSFLGGVASFKSQNAVSGLPLEIGPDEVALAVRKGWAVVKPPALQDLKSALIKTQQPSQSVTQHNPSLQAKHTQHEIQDLKERVSEQHESAKRGRDEKPVWGWLKAYYEYYDALGVYDDEHTGLAHKRQRYEQSHASFQDCRPPVQHTQSGANNTDGQRKVLVIENRADKFEARQREKEARQQQHQHRHHPHSDRPQPAWLQSYYEYYTHLGAFGTEAQRQVQQPSQNSPQQQQNQQPHAPGAYRDAVSGGSTSRRHHPSPDAVDDDSNKEQGCPAVQQHPSHVAAWKSALKDGHSYALPIKASDLMPSSHSTGQHDTAGRAASSHDNASGDATDTGKASGQDADAGTNKPNSQDGVHAEDLGSHGYPESDREKLRHQVFQHLHSQGYATSAGPRFGSDLLAYPGDPALFHAQFTVRLLQPDAPINPLALKGAARGSHAARKHLLLSTVFPTMQQEGSDVQSQQQQPFFISIAPEAGFGKAN